MKINIVNDLLSAVGHGVPMSLQPEHNKYVHHFPAISIIQKYLTKHCTRYLIPSIDNTNIDRSVAVIHSIVLRCLPYIAKQQSLYSIEAHQCTSLYDEYVATTNRAWSSKAMQLIIKSKSQKKRIVYKIVSISIGCGSSTNCFCYLYCCHIQ